jgi:NAD(P)-dependent dehydrogenase (short-subunit alcohol dehydrogenase family)
LTKTLAVDLADDGILVTAITPGWVKTDMGTMKADLTVRKPRRTYAMTNTCNVTFQVEESTTAVVQTILQLNVDHAGVLLRRNGEQINF